MPPFVVDGQRVDVTTSIGIAFHRAAGSSATATELLARADAALYNAKAAGRDRFAFFMPSGESNSSSDSPTRQEY
jgi:GGDEF domain-containing protein